MRLPINKLCFFSKSITLLAVYTTMTNKQQIYQVPTIETIYVVLESGIARTLVLGGDDEGSGIEDVSDGGSWGDF